MFEKRRKRYLTTTRIIAIGFLVGIILGTVLLMLPFAATDGKVTPFLDSLFTATTSICVTGLTTVSTCAHWSLFGQIVILILVQFGGLGVVTFTTCLLLLLGRRITLGDRLLLQDAYNLDSLQGIVKLTRRVIKSALLVEGIGAVMYLAHFLQEYSIPRAIWYSVFHAVSAFCNAGLDLLGDSSLSVYRDNVWMNLITMLLIIIGGIGFPIWWDVTEGLRNVRKGKYPLIHFYRHLKVYSKLVITITVILIFTGCILTFLLEHSNPDTLGQLPIGNKLLASLFQSVTTRTAGFYTIPQQNFGPASSVVSLLLMFIGGSPSGTAGGVKTVTVAVILLSSFSLFRGKRDAEVLKRRISEQYIRKSLAVIVLSFSIMLCMTVLLAQVQGGNLLDIVFETTSAIATVGLSRNLTGTLVPLGKLIIIITMYLGRIGPITLALAFNNKEKHNGGVKLPDGKFLVG